MLAGKDSAITTTSYSGPGEAAAAREAAADQAYSRSKLVAAGLGPLLGCALWFAPLGMEPAAQHALAIVAMMIVYWVTEPIDHGLTALLGCFLFWALRLVEFEVAFSGFAVDTPWFLFGALLMGQAATRSGLARRIGLTVMRAVGTSYRGLLLGVIIFVFILNFLVPSGLAQLSIVAPIVIGIIAAFGADRRSNIACGLFVILTYLCGLFNKMILSGGASILTRGLVEKVTGTSIYWSQYVIAYLPASLITIVAAWLTILWLYPPEQQQLPGGRRYLQEIEDQMGPWTAAEKKSLAWLLLAISLWATDLLHHISPAVIALAVGLAFTLPKIGVLTTKNVREVNFLLIIFMGGALSMGQVLSETKALDVLTNVMVTWMSPLMGNPVVSASVLYWTAVAYHFLLASELSMLSTSLPVIIHYADTNGFNPMAFAMVWNFASGGKIFVYQSAVLMLGYGFGYFSARDLLKVGLTLTIVEGIVLALLVAFYWPLVGLHMWQ